jgi:hypothetical protein
LGSPGFRTLSWHSIGIGAALFWSILAVILISATWQAYYSHFVPRWYFFVTPVGVVFLYSLIGIFLRWAALRIPGSPVIWFCALGGLEAIPEHAVGIYRFNILEIPLLEGSSAFSIFLFAFFEYVLYWGIVLVLSIGVERVIRAWQAKRTRQE